MALGAYTFEALGFSFQDIGRDVSTPWAQLAVASGHDQLQWTGPKQETVTIKGAVFNEEFGGQESLDGIRQSALSGLPMPLVALTGDVFPGTYVVEGISEDRSYYTGSGGARKNAYTIKLKLYTGALSGVPSVLRGLF
jgi:hypothetical protein